MIRRLWSRSLSLGLFSSVRGEKRKRGESESVEAPGPAHASILCALCSADTAVSTQILAQCFLRPSAPLPLSSTTRPAPTGAQVSAQTVTTSCQVSPRGPATPVLPHTCCCHQTTPLVPPLLPHQTALSHTQMGVGKPATFSSRFNSNAKLGRRAVSHSIFSLGERK